MQPNNERSDDYKQEASSLLNGSADKRKERKSSCLPWCICIFVVLIIIGVLAWIVPVLRNPKTINAAYRPLCTVYTSKKVQLIQTSLAHPDEQWAHQTCTLDAYDPFYADNVPRYNVASARLEVDLDKIAHPNREPIMGFGGAFTEASALNYEALTQEGKDAVMELLFGKTGLGYSMGRVHMNSCDFCTASYNFDGENNDINLTDFDVGVQHDARVGMVPMMLRATSVFRQSWTAPGDGDLKLLVSPWSPPAWMKAPTPGMPANATHAANMLGSAQPTCIRDGVGPNSKYAKAWAQYFSKFLTAYQDLGLPVYAVTIQNEPAFDAPWEACVYTPQTMGDFLANHLGPELNSTFPDVKIFIFDNNKDLVDIWAHHLLNSSASAPYIDGTAFHWYDSSVNRYLDGAVGTPNVHRLIQMTKDFNVEKKHLVWGTEACHCPSTSYATGSLNESWKRAERYAHDVLADMAAGANAWIEWNLVLDGVGGPNHLGNLCDSGVLSVPQRATGVSGIPQYMPFEKQYLTINGNHMSPAELDAMGMPARFIEKGVVVQPMHYYMGHISRHVRPGSRAVMALVNAAKTSEGQIFRPKNTTAPGGGPNHVAMSGIELTTWPCEGSTRQYFIYNDAKQFEAHGYNFVDAPSVSCVANSPDNFYEGITLGNCGWAGQFEFVPVSGGAADPNATEFQNVNVVLKNSNYKAGEDCMIIKELENNGGALGPLGGAQITYGSCKSAKAVWSFNKAMGQLSSMYFGEEVCMTTGWPFLQMGAFDTPNGGSEKVVVILNEANETANYILENKEEVLVAGHIPANSIQTVLVN